MMEIALIGILIAVSVVMLGTGLSHRGGIFEYPFLAGATFLGFVVPQLPGLAGDRFLPPGAFVMTVAFTIGCALMCLIGWRVGTRPLASMQRVAFDERRVLRAAAGLSVFGALFFYLFSRLPLYVQTETMPSGLSTIYLFFTKALSYGFALATFCCIRRFSKPALFIVLVDFAILAHHVIVAGRRADFTEIGLIILLALWFTRDIAFPRILALIASLGAGVALTSVGDYRSLAHDRDAPKFSSVSQINVLGNFETLLSRGGDEMRNAILRISAVNKNQNFDYGIYHWNVLVFDFVPAQLVGADVKQALMIPVPDQADIDYQPTTVGSTETGMTDAFGSFWYFGVLKFFLVAYAMGRLYRTALSGSFLAQIIFALSITPSMHVITHHTQWMLSTWFNMLLLLMPPLLTALQPSGRAPLGAIPASSRQSLAARTLT